MPAKKSFPRRLAPRWGPWLNILADAVKVTLGPKAARRARALVRRADRHQGRRLGGQGDRAVKDTSSRTWAAQMVKEVASKTSDVAGTHHDRDGPCRGDRARGDESSSPPA